jgi:hypothetical protein
MGFETVLPTPGIMLLEVKLRQWGAALNAAMFGAALLPELLHGGGMREALVVNRPATMGTSSHRSGQGLRFQKGGEIFCTTLLGPFQPAPLSLQFPQRPHHVGEGGFGRLRIVGF